MWITNKLYEMIINCKMPRLSVLQGFYFLNDIVILWVSLFISMNAFKAMVRFSNKELKRINLRSIRKNNIKDRNSLSKFL
ncbi:hypothetical protein BpHYR1_030030 [Brachionus plicatilis]|uniref:Uncharacterized protein n=1 Tax=Brachionus plicatilis TaxID=10195 RepID=A0A3M7S346_BRAPC|nr:hypothetical protein BpHYR1_030030 [Brachionus plicatilis]